MLAVLYYKTRDYKKMDSAFLAATKYSPKQGLLWSMWAFCNTKLGKNDKAMQILLQGKAKLGSADPRIASNLNNLQNKKRMKMRNYGEQWYQFQLEMSPNLRQVKGGHTRFARR